MVAEALAWWGAERSAFATVEPALVRHLLELASPADARWSARLADALHRKRLDGAHCLDVLAVLAPVLAHLCGRDFAGALAERISAPLPVPSFARPWARAGTRVVEA